MGNMTKSKTFKKNLSNFLSTFEKLWKMEHLLEKSKCFIFHNVFQLNDISKVSKCVLWSKGLIKLVTQIKGIVCLFWC